MNFEVDYILKEEEIEYCGTDIWKRCQAGNQFDTDLEEDQKVNGKTRYEKIIWNPG